MSGAGRFVTNLATPIDKEVRDLYAYTNPGQFAKLSDEELAKHITSIRDKAYKIAPWPCLGAFRFLNPGIAHAGPSNTYSSILEHLRSHPDAKVLDLGCCFGHDARQLLKDGVKSDQIVACDLLTELIDLGFEMFSDHKDQAHLKGMRWDKVDVFNQQDLDKIKQPDGYHAIYVGSFIHLFPLEYQKKVVSALNELLSKEKGSKVWGRQVGTELGTAGPRKERVAKGSRGPTGIEAEEDGSREPAYVHDTQTLAKLFEDAYPGSWAAEINNHDWAAEKGNNMQAGDGEVMIEPGRDRMMKRLTFVVVRK